MELLETQDPEKIRLIETSARHRHEMEKEVKAISEKTERVVTNALLIGGALALSYFAFTQFSKTKNAKKKFSKEESENLEEENGMSFISQIGTKVMTQATLILLEIAKEKLNEYLQTRKQSNEHS